MVGLHYRVSYSHRCGIIAIYGAHGGNIIAPSKLARIFSVSEPTIYNIKTRDVYAQRECNLVGLIAFYKKYVTEDFLHLIGLPELKEPEWDRYD